MRTVRTGSLLLVAVAIAGCRSSRVGPWDDVPPATRHAYDQLHRELRLVLAAPPDPTRRSELARIREELEVLLRDQPRFFRARRDLQDVIVELDPALGSRMYADDQEDANAEELTLAARWLPISDAKEKRELLRRAQELEGGFPWSFYGHALVEAREREWDAALELLERALDRDPDFREARTLRAFVLDSAGRTEDALEAYTDALDEDPGDLEARYRYAHLLLESDDRQDLRRARAELETVLEVPARLGELAGAAALDLGVALSRQGLGEAALAQFRTARSLGADPLDAAYNIGWVLEEVLGRPREALEVYREYLEQVESGEVSLRPSQVLDYLFHVQARVRNLEERLGGASRR